MAKYTEAQARSAQKYLSKFAEIRIRLKPEEKEIIVSIIKELRKEGKYNE